MESVLAVAAVGGLVAALAERASNKNSIKLPPGDHGDLAAGCCALVTASSFSLCCTAFVSFIFF